MRGTKEEVFVPRGKLCKRLTCGMKIRRIDRWRLTTRSQKLFHRNLGWWFVLMCMHNIFFLVAFQMKDMISALCFMVFYYVSLVQTYLKVGAFRKFRPPLKLTVEEEMLATRARVSYLPTTSRPPTVAPNWLPPNRLHRTNSPMPSTR